ncbi:terminase small subunit [Acetobacter estunensis]|uniref:terminase small subunit n=1 Tax=Acetobacter estunensis TaxID=104097 RepID=UPI001C2DAC90|nr:terminase small subunit [Acetobacter estunensis]MBV1835642.1 terminase small subunit [Acetobacter estunensis]MBV1836097.1 terminase small subunit [Acetobacter estunensis]
MLNKRELSRRLKVSLPTLTAWMERWPEFPVAQRGTNGSSYRFDVEAVFAFLSERREEEAQQKAGRDEQLMALQLSFGDLFPAPDPVSDNRRRLSTKEEIDLWKLRDLKRKEAERSGQLVIAAEVEQLFQAALARLNRDATSFIRRLGQQERWSDAQMRSIEARFADMQRQSVRDALALLDEEPDADERQLNLT